MQTHTHTQAHTHACMHKHTHTLPFQKAWTYWNQKCWLDNTYSIRKSVNGLLQCTAHLLCGKNVKVCKLQVLKKCTTHMKWEQTLMLSMINLSIKNTYQSMVVFYYYILLYYYCFEPLWSVLVKSIPSFCYSHCFVLFCVCVCVCVYVYNALCKLFW